MVDLIRQDLARHRALATAPAPRVIPGSGLEVPVECLHVDFLGQHVVLDDGPCGRLEGVLNGLGLVLIEGRIVGTVRIDADDIEVPGGTILRFPHLMARTILPQL